MPDKAIHSDAIIEGLDRENLNQLEKRFVSLNADRLARTKSALGERQEIFLDLLPLLFHVNHPMLPGYVSSNTPAGVAHYVPNKRDLELGRTLARSFSMPHPGRECNIDALYLMGSVGTVAHSEQSDLDIWVCYRPGLEAEELEALQQKGRLITAWATELRLEAHFFLMDAEAFKRGKLSALNTESSGSAQQLLLLDEFYRTSVHLAGRLPLWWFVPPRAELDYESYAAEVLHRRFLPENRVLDFGGVAAIPDGEFLGAGVWQLYKAIESPYKSVLKLLLLEAYVSDHPQITPLAIEFKQRVYDGCLETDALDSYIMIYRRIEQHLIQRQQSRRLELARRCLYFKINKPLSRPATGKTKSWQRKLLERLVREWGWSENQIQMLDERPRWKAARVIEERSQLVNELNHSYRFLTEFASASGAARAISGEELTVLGRKLQAAFERKPGKIEHINPSISGDLSEQLLVLTQSVREDGQRWAMAPPPPAQADPYKQSTSLVELLLWCYYNGIVTTDTQFDLSDTDLDPGLVRRLLNSLHRWLPKTARTLSHQRFQKSAVPTHALLLINTTSETAAQWQDVELQRASNRIDALGYSALQNNLVVSIDFVLRNSWGEISCQRFEGEQALLSALEEYLRLSLPGTQQVPPALEIECLGLNHAAMITQRVQEWFRDISACYYATKDSSSNGAAGPHRTEPPRGNTRYVFTMAGSFYGLQFVGPRLHIDRFASETGLLRWLGQDQASYSAFVIDKRAFIKHPLALIAEHSRAEAINVFYQAIKGGLRLYVVDERGSLVTFTAHSYTLVPLHRFLRAVMLRQARASDQSVSGTPRANVQFFELQRDRQEKLTCQPVRVNSEVRPGLLIDVKAAVGCDNQGRYNYSFYCDQDEFSQLEHGKQLFEVTARYIRSRRTTTQSYPVYLSDLDLDLCRNRLTPDGHLQISHYLRLKLELEQSLNKALPA